MRACIFIINCSFNKKINSNEAKALKVVARSRDLEDFDVVNRAGGMPGRKKSKSASNDSTTTSGSSSNKISSLQPPPEMTSFDMLTANFHQVVSPEAITKRNALREMHMIIV